MKVFIFNLGVPASKKGYFTQYTQSACSFFAGYSIHINARSEADVSPFFILSKVSTVVAKYSIHQEKVGQSTASALESLNPGSTSNYSSSTHQEKVPPVPTSFNPGSTSNYSPSTFKTNFAMPISKPPPPIKPIQQTPAYIPKPAITPQNTIVSSREKYEQEQREREEQERERSGANFRAEREKREAEERQREKERQAKEFQPRSSIGSNDIRAEREKREAEERQREKQSKYNQNTSVSSGSNDVRAERERREAEERQREAERIKRIEDEEIRESENALRNSQTRQYNPPIVESRPVKSEFVSAPKSDFINASRNVPAPKAEYVPAPRNVPASKTEYTPAPVKSEPTPRNVPTPKSESAPRLPSAPKPKSISARALYDYEAQESNELNLSEGVVITNIEKVDTDWWSGHFAGNIGLFPSSYVEEIEDFEVAGLSLDNDRQMEEDLIQRDEERRQEESRRLAEKAEKDKRAADERARKEKAEREEIARIQKAENERKISEEKAQQMPSSLSAVALYDYDANEINEVSFRENDVITDIVQLDEGWWQGYVNGKNGLFPSNYVHLKRSQQPAIPQRSNGIQVTALFDYEAGESNEISFQEGQVITNVEKIDADWWKGKVGDTVGLFPASYVE